MQEKDQIANLFKDTFSNYEETVRPELWQNVASKIQVPSTPPIPDGSATTQSIVAGSKIAGSVLSWVAGAVLVASVATGYYFYSTKTPVVNQVQNFPSVGTETEKPQQVEVTSNTPSTTPENITVDNKSSIQKPTGSAASHETGISSEAIDKVNEPVHTNANPLADKEIAAPVNSDKETSEKHADQNQHPLQLTNQEVPVIKVKINASVTSGYAPLEINFSNISSEEVGEWHFGDSGESTKGTAASHTFKDPGNYLVTYKVTDASGKTYTDLVKIEVLSDLNITYVPNIFTPNGDGVNDVFTISTDKDLDIEVSIFDKNGKFVYKYSGKENGWNGKINNLRDAEEGTYFYVIFAADKNGAKNTQKGTITLKR